MFFIPRVFRILFSQVTPDKLTLRGAVPIFQAVTRKNYRRLTLQESFLHFPSLLYKVLRFFLQDVFLNA